MSGGAEPLSRGGGREGPAEPDAEREVHARAAPSAEGGNPESLTLEWTVETADGESLEIELGGLPLPENAEDMDIKQLIATLSLTIRKNSVETQTVRIELGGQKIDDRNAKALESMMENVRKMAEAKKSGSFAKVFGWVALAAAAIVTIATFNPAVGVTVGFAVSAAAVAGGTAMMIASEVGGLEDLSMEAQLALMISAAFLMFIAPCATAATQASTAAAAAQGLTATQRVLTQVRLAGGVLESLTTAAASTAQVNTGRLRYDADRAAADVRTNEARAERAQGEVDEALEALEALMEVADKMMSVVLEILRDNAQANARVHRNFA